MNPDSTPGSIARDPMRDLDDDLVALIKPELAPGERVIWAAKSKPRDGSSCATALLYFAPAFLLVGLGSIALAFSPVAPRFQPIDGLVLGVGYVASIISVFMVAGILTSWVEGWYERRALKKNLYALTDRRVILWIPEAERRGVQVHTVAKGSVERTSRTEYPDGSGHLSFEPARQPYGTGPAIRGVPDVRRVEELVRSILIDPESPSETPSPRGNS